MEKEAKSNKNYIICDVAESNWGKSETLVEAVSLIKKIPGMKIIEDKPINKGKDRWFVGELNGKTIVVSSLGDPTDRFTSFLDKAFDKNPCIFVTACRPCDITQTELCHKAKGNGYDIIWFKNFHIDDKKLATASIMAEARRANAEAISKLVEVSVI